MMNFIRRHDAYAPGARCRSLSHTRPLPSHSQEEGRVEYRNTNTQTSPSLKHQGISLPGYRITRRTFDRVIADGQFRLRIILQPFYRNTAIII
jgi:hypothetical protein